MPTPEELELMRQRLAGGPAPAPTAAPPRTFLERLSDSAERINANPVMRGISYVTNPVGTAIQSALRPEVTVPEVTITDDRAQSSTPFADDGSGTVSAPVATRRQITIPETVISGGPSSGGGGGGLFSNPMALLRQRWEDAQNKQLGDFDHDKKLAEDQGMNTVARIQAISDLQQQDADKMAAEAARQKEIDDAATAKHEAFMARNQELADDVGKQQVDPGRFFQNKAAGEKALYVVGGILGGMLQGLQGSGENSFIRQVNHLVDEDIRAQQSSIDNKKAALGARGSLLNQMMAETGDRRLAQIQTRNLMFESMKQSLAAKADALGIPEVRTRAEQGIQAIQKEQDAMNTALRQQGYASAVAQANAAAAARAHAEKVAWDRMIEVQKLGLEKDKLTIEGRKVDKDLGDDAQKQLQELSKQMADPKLVANRKAVEDLNRELFNADGSAKIGANGKREQLAGVGPVGDARAALKPTKDDAYNPGFALMKGAANAVAGLSPEERVNRQNLERVALAYKNAVTGAGGSDAEAKQIMSAFYGAKSPEEIANAAQLANDIYSRQEARITAGYDPSVVKVFRARVAGTAPTMPGTVVKK